MTELDPNMLIETHAHYNLPCFADDLDEVIASVRAAGVGKIICPAISFESNAHTTCIRP